MFQRDKDMKLASFDNLRHIIDNILEGLFAQRSISVIWTVRYSHARVQESIKIINFSDRSDCRSRIVRHCFLVNGDRWRKSTNFSHTGRLWNIGNNHPSIRRKWLEVSSLSFSIEGIKGKWWFPWAWNSGNNCQSIFRNRHIYSLKIMGFCVDDFDSIRHNYLRLLEARNRPYTFSTHASLRVSAIAFAVDHVEITSSIRTTIFGIGILLFIWKFPNFFSRLFVRESFDWRKRNGACKSWMQGMSVAFSTFFPSKYMWSYHRMKYFNQCIGAGTMTIPSSFFRFFKSGLVW